MKPCFTQPASLSPEIRSLSFQMQVTGFNRSSRTFSCVLDYRSPTVRSSSCRVLGLNKRRQRVISADRPHEILAPSGAFVKLRKLRHACSSNSMEQLGSHWTDLYEILYFRLFRKSVDIQVSLHMTKITGALYEDRYTIMINSR